MNEFDVFDEWGNWVGKFTPEDSSGGVVGTIVLLFVGILLFAVYAFFKLIYDGFKALFRGELLKACLYFTPIWMTLLYVLFVSTVVGGQVLMSRNISNMISIENLSFVECNGARNYSYTVKNISNRDLIIDDYSALYENVCEPENIGAPRVVSHKLAPGEKVVVWQWDVLIKECSLGVIINNDIATEICPLTGKNK